MNPYTLQPGLARLDKNAAQMAPDAVLEYPQSTNLNDNTRAISTVLVGTAPYKGQKGAPAALVDVATQLRPSDTRLLPAERDTESNAWPPVMPPSDVARNTAPGPTPASTRGDIQNALFVKRYGK